MPPMDNPEPATDPTTDTSTDTDSPAVVSLTWWLTQTYDLIVAHVRDCDLVDGADNPIGGPAVTGATPTTSGDSDPQQPRSRSITG